jgi:y4mF family transcriptional regulator
VDAERDERLATLAATVRSRRRSLGLTQTDLGELAGTSLRFVHTLEHAKGSVRLDKVLDVLDVLGLELQTAPVAPSRTAPGPTPSAASDDA